MPQTLENHAPAVASGRYATAAEWWDALGRVPMARIVFPPHAGLATEEDVAGLDDHQDRLCEWIDGTLVEKEIGFEESLITSRIIVLLSLHVSASKLGIVVGPDGMMRILPNRIRIPDAAYINFARLPGGKVPKDAIPSLAPDLAVEVLSEGNTTEEMRIKLQDYFAAGTRLVWYVNPRSRSVDVYTSAVQVIHLSDGDVLTGGDVLPGFQTPLAAIFDLA